MAKNTIKKSPLAKARDEWFSSKEGKGCCSDIPSGRYYLSNRLLIAFIAGWDAANVELKQVGGKSRMKGHKLGKDANRRLL